MDAFSLVFLSQANENAGVALAVVAAAFAGAIIAGVLRAPKPIGYLIAGVAVGPVGLSWVDDRDQVTLAAEVGVTLLLFAVGLELSFRELSRNLRAALLIGLGEALLVGAVVVIAAGFLDVSPAGALVLASAAGISSTAAGVVLVSDPRGRAAVLAPMAIGILIVQDAIAIVAIALVPSLDEAEPDVIVTAVLGVAAALGLLLMVLPLAAAATSAAMRALGSRIDRELFLVAVLTLVGGAAAGSAAIGLSPAIGAFVAGLLIRQSGYAHQALSETLGLRDLFAAVFFVSIGLLFEPSVATDEPQLVLLLLGAVIFVKLFAVAAIARLTGLPIQAALLLGVILANAGEFSFVVVDVADESVLSETQFSALVFVVVVSLLLSNIVAGVGNVRRTRLKDRPEDTVAIVGFGRFGREVANELRSEGRDVVVIEHDPQAAARAQADGFHTVWGDVTQRRVLRDVGRPAAIVISPGGAAGARIVETIAEWLPRTTRVVAAVMPSHLASLGIDLTVLDIDRQVARDVSSLVDQALSRPARGVRPAHGFRHHSVHAAKEAPRVAMAVALDVVAEPTGRMSYVSRAGTAADVARERDVSYLQRHGFEVNGPGRSSWSSGRTALFLVIRGLYAGCRVDSSVSQKARREPTYPADTNKRVTRS